MDEGFVQLLFVLILMFASLLDVIGRGKRKRRGQTGELPQEDETPPEVTRPRRRPQERRAPGAPSAPPRGAPTPTPTPTQSTQPPAGPRETADTMVPEDLWAILTGEAPPTRVPRPREPEAEPWSDEEDHWTGEGVPYPREGESTEAETWRPEVTAEELPPTEAPPEVLPEDERRRPTAPRSTAPRPTAPRPWIPTEIRPTGGWARVPTLTTAGAHRAAPSAPLAVQASERSPASRYADLLRTGTAAGRLDALRTAIVLREVLDQPLALRPSRSGGLG
jgi:hypothetical protein